MLESIKVSAILLGNIEKVLNRGLGETVELFCLIAFRAGVQDQQLEAGYLAGATDFFYQYYMSAPSNPLASKACEILTCLVMKDLNRLGGLTALVAGATESETRCIRVLQLVTQLAVETKARPEAMLGHLSAIFSLIYSVLQTTHNSPLKLHRQALETLQACVLLLSAEVLAELRPLLPPLLTLFARNLFRARILELLGILVKKGLEASPAFAC